MLKRKRNQFFILMLTFTFLFSGCGLEGDAGKEVGKSEGKKLTRQEIIERSNREVESVNGISIQSKQKVSMEEMNLDLNIDMTTTMTYEPAVVHIKGKGLTPGGDSFEMYLDESLIYMKDPDKGWMKMSSDDMEDLFNTDMDSLIENPKDVLDDIKKLNDSYKMSQKDDFYVLELDASAAEIEKIKEMMTKNEISTMGRVMQGLDTKDEKELADIMKDIKIHSFQRVLWIDEKTFELKKMEQKTQFEVVMGGSEVRMEQDMLMTIKGYVDKVTVPDEVKKNAIDISDKE